MTEDASPENLRKFLENDDPALVRMGLSMAKGTGVPKELLQIIIEIYLSDPFYDKNIREAAKSIFVRDERAVEPLIKALSGAYLIRRFAARALGEIGDERAVEPLIKIIGDKGADKPENCGARRAAVKALGDIGDKQAVESLIKVFEDDWRIRKDAAEALRKIVVKIKEKDIGNEKENIIKFLESDDQGMVRMGASLLKGILIK